MLLELHVKNLALIEQADVEFQEGFHALTGETGAGKSILIGSINLALGAKAPRDIIRQGAEAAYVELIFSVTEPEKREALERLGVSLPEDGLLIISRKMTAARSIGRINDETVTAARLREITGLLLDIHGQHEHQSLLYKQKHLEILDVYNKINSQPLKTQIARSYREYHQITERLSGLNSDQESRLREADFLRFEIEEIENGCLREGEEEELSNLCRKLSAGQKIAAGLSAAYEALQGMSIDRVIKEVEETARYDGQLSGIKDQLYDAESILQDAEHEISSYLDSMVFDEESFARAQERLDQIRTLTAKYGGSVSRIQERLLEKRERLEELEHFDQVKAQLEAQLVEKQEELEKLCGQLSETRKAAAKELTGRMRESLEDLNFMDVRFSMEFKRLDHYTAGGYDEAEFMISTNPGEPLKPLGAVASGGELSRIMLAIKSVLADSDDIPTLIFDEIDTGISGRTAQKVSEKLAYIARTHQVICITHLPQIAAMADCHFEIEKAARDGKTTTAIRRLDQEQSIAELARLLGGARITDGVLETAREMKELAQTAREKAMR